MNPDTGAAWPANANAGLADLNARKIIGYGLRNPFRFTFDEDGSVWIGDVGFGVWEEINEIPDPDAAARNFGWPCYEGPDQQTSYWNPASNPAYDPALCTSISGQAAPMLAYSHASTVVAGDACGTGSSAIAGLAFLGEDTEYPDAFDGALFWTDYNRKCIWYAPRGANDQPDSSQTRPVRRSADRLGHRPAGPRSWAPRPMATSCTRASIAARSGRSASTRPTRRPPRRSPSRRAMASRPSRCDLDASGSTDSNGDTLTYAWDFDDDGQYDDATGVAPTTTLSTPGDIEIGLRVTDDGDPVLSDTASHVVSVDNAPPVINFSAPSASLTWVVGQGIAFAATATDAQDGTIPASEFHWDWAIAHCRPAECHEHDVQSFDGVRNGTFSAPDHPYPSYLRVTLTVADDDGLETTVTREVCIRRPAP